MTPRTYSATLATAYHEAGHAVVAWHLGVRVRRVSIVPGADTAGRCHHEKLIRGKYPELDDSLRAVLRMQKNIMTSLAGLIAQRNYKPPTVRNYHAHADHCLAVDIALQLCGSEDEAGALIKWLHIRTRNVVRLHWPFVQALAQELTTRPNIDGRGSDELSFSIQRRMFVMTTAPRVIAPRKKGNLDTRGQSFAGVEGKTVRQIEAYLMEGGDEPAIRIDFADGTALDIVMGSNPDLKAEWMRTSDEKDGPLRRARFIAQR